MAELKIDASEIKNEGKHVIKELVDFIKEKTNANVTKNAEIVTVEGESKVVSKKYLRVLVKKFLHKRELKEYYRVIAGDEDTLKVKERRLYESEEE